MGRIGGKIGLGAIDSRRGPRRAPFHLCAGSEEGRRVGRPPVRTTSNQQEVSHEQIAPEGA